MGTVTPAAKDRALALIAVHAARYPAWCVIDAYKLLFQACMGPGHAVADTPTVRRRLAAEWRCARSVSDVAILEDITLHAPLARLHLGAAKARGVHPRSVLGDFLRCARTFPQRPDLLADLWPLLCHAIHTGDVPVADAAELDAIDRRLREAGLTAVSHSAAYRTAYAPAYRLVGTGEADGPIRP